MAHRFRHLPRQRLPLLALARVQAELHPVELGEDVVGQIELTVTPDVHLGAAQDAKRRQLLVRSGDLLALPAEVVRVEAGHDTDVPRVVADRQVLVAEVACGGRHLEHGGLAVRPRGVTVEIAAHVGELDERRRLAAKRLLA